MNEDTTLLNKLVTQVGTALGGKEDDQTLWLPCWRRVLLELLVLSPSVATRFVAIKHRNRMLTVHFHTIFAATECTERHNRTAVCGVEFIGGGSTMCVLKPHTFHKSRIWKALRRFRNCSRQCQPTRIVRGHEFSKFFFSQVVVDHSRIGQIGNGRNRRKGRR